MHISNSSSTFRKVKKNAFESKLERENTIIAKYSTIVTPVSLLLLLLFIKLLTETNQQAQHLRLHDDGGGGGGGRRGAESSREKRRRGTVPFFSLSLSQFYPGIESRSS